MESGPTLRPHRILIATLACLIATIYLYGLTAVGMYSTDEPRYAFIGRAMAQSGDWITPHRWGSPWFEKPPLVYWMTALGFRLGLSDDLAPRLPLAVLSLVFLWFFFRRVARVFDRQTGLVAVAILATSAGWIAYSRVAVMDVPMSVFFSAAVLFALPATSDGEPNRTASAAALGLAVLAKSLPPLVLFFPVLWFDRKNWRRWFLAAPLLVFLVIALPWHIAVTARNGYGALGVLFGEQQFGRFLNPSRQHVQPWWFYGPVFLALCFPWFPLLPGAAFSSRRDPRARVLTAVAVFGFIFFSLSVNKLPGYVLPLLPVTAILIAVRFADHLFGSWRIATVIALLGIFPGLESVLPDVAARGLRLATVPWNPVLIGLISACIVAGIVVTVARERGQNSLFFITAVLAGIGFFALEFRILPQIDQAASGRSIWLKTHPQCAPDLPRGTLYGLYYYAGKALPSCAIVDSDSRSK